MNNHSVLKVNKSGKYEYIIIYYKLGKDILRIPTKEVYEKSKMNKDLTFNIRKEDNERINKRISVLKKKVDSYITDRLSYYVKKVNQKDCLKFIETGETVQEKKIEKITALDFVEKFKNWKINELGVSSANQYTSLYMSMKEFQKLKNKTITFDDLNDVEFLSEYKNFLGNVKKNKNNTIALRFKTFKTFINYIEEKEIFTFKISTKKYKQEQYAPTIVTLDNADIKLLMNLEIENKRWAVIRDLFVFNFFCGLRFSDLSTLRPDNFKIDADGDYTIIQENKKTDYEVVIPVHPVAVEIAKKYNFQLPVIDLHNFNNQLTDILDYYDLFSDIILIKKRVLNEPPQDYTIMRRKMIKTHTMRRSAITRWFEEKIPLTNLMAASGHTTISSIKSYMKIQQNKEEFFKSKDL